MPGETYVSPDNLRDTATRMFGRNQQDRASFNVITTTPQQHSANGHEPQQQQPGAYRPQQNGGEPEKRSIKDVIANRFKKSPMSPQQQQQRQGRFSLHEIDAICRGQVNPWVKCLFSF